MRRGQFITVALAGDYGKPRPALIVQSDAFAALPSIVFCPLTTKLRNDAPHFRIEVLPSKRNGLRVISQISIDKIAVLPINKIGNIIGIADNELMLRVSRALAVFLGIA